MKYRPLQIGNVILPEYALFAGDIQVGTQDLELGYKDGSLPFNTQPKVNSRSCSILCSYFDKYGRGSDELKVLKSLYFDKLQALSRSKQTLYLVGQDDKIYKLRVTVSAGQFNGDDFGNGFDFTLPMKAYDPFFEECGNKLYLASVISLQTPTKFIKYDNSITYFYGRPKLVLADKTKVDVPLLELEPPLNWIPDDNYIGKQFWDSSTSTASITGTGSTSFDLSDIQSSSSSFVITTSNIAKTNTITFSSSQNISTHADLSNLTVLDVIEFKVKVSVLANLSQLDLTILSDSSNYIKINLLNLISYVSDGVWGTIRLNIFEFIKTGNINFGSITAIKIDHTNTAACIVKFNDFRVVKVFGLNMNQIAISGMDIENYSLSSRLEAWFCFSDSATIRQVYFEDQVLTTSKRVLAIFDDGWAEGDTPLTLAKKGNFPTKINIPQIGISYNSDQPVSGYYNIYKTFI